MSDTPLKTEPNFKIKYDTLIDEWKEFPFVFHIDSKDKPVRTWVLKDIEFQYCIDGAAEVLLDERGVDVSTGKLLCINPYVTHKLIPKGSVRLAVLVIDSKFCTNNDIDISEIYFNDSEAVEDERARELFCEIISEYESEDGYRSGAIRASVLKFLVYMCRNHSGRSEKTQDKSRPRSFDNAFDYTSRAIDYINQNLGKKIMLDDVATASGASKYHFLRIFKQVTGYTVTDYINRVRCNHAKNIILSGKYNIKEVALQVGFENLSHFTNTFKKYEGCLPSELLKKDK